MYNIPLESYFHVLSHDVKLLMKLEHYDMSKLENVVVQVC